MGGFKASLDFNYNWPSASKLTNDHYKMTISASGRKGGPRAFYSSYRIKVTVLIFWRNY